MILALALAGCSHATSGDLPDAGPTPSTGALTLTLSLVAPQVDGLSITSGRIELRKVSLFGDVAADSRTMASAPGLSLPTDANDTTFPLAPYGLYSRVQVGVDELRIHGTWRGVPLSVAFDDQSLIVDLRGPSLDYEQTQSAHFLVNIDSTSWWNAAALDGADGAGTAAGVQIDYLHNPTLATAFLAAFQASFKLDVAPVPTT